MPRRINAESLPNLYLPLWWFAVCVFVRVGINWMAADEAICCLSYFVGNRLLVSSHLPHTTLLSRSLSLLFNTHPPVSRVLWLQERTHNHWLAYTNTHKLYAYSYSHAFTTVDSNARWTRHCSPYKSKARTVSNWLSANKGRALDALLLLCLFSLQGCPLLCKHT